MDQSLRSTAPRLTSIWVGSVAWFFRIAGIVFALMTVVALVAFILDMPPQPGAVSYPVVLLILGALAAILLVTGSLIARRARMGAFLALALNLYPLAFVLAGTRPLSWLDVVTTLGTVAVVASIWPQLKSPLSPAG